MSTQMNKTVVKKINNNTFSNEVKKIYYANIIARMTSKFNLEEEKALHIFFSYIKPFNFQNSTTIKIEKKKFFEQLNLTGDDKYKRYKLLIYKMKIKSIIIIETEKSIFDGFLLISSEWYKKELYFEVDLNPKLMPFIEQLKEHYTKVDLNTVCSFKSKHALTLYKFLCSWTNENKKENKRYVTTKDLKELFGLSKEAYVENKNFKRAKFEKRTIDVAIKEINQYSDLNINYDKKKENGKVKKYQFIWVQKDKQIVKSLEINKTNQNQNTISKEQMNDILTNIDKDDEVVFDK
ncbi:MAG: replication initiation protein [Spiroplasma ixodetis]|nr:replication initiation protein [Spiroplasma ixodetis]MBP1527249.1 replication initiation protein [Spiroplasma ixodetis]MBP1528425.1 replication initiation protein [Spiroplasma ixodetis]